METQNTPQESPHESPWTARVITLFPEAFPGALDLSLSGKALKTTYGDWKPSPCVITVSANTAMLTHPLLAVARGW